MISSWQTNFTWFRAFCESTCELKANRCTMSKQCQKCNTSLEAKFCPDCGSKTVDKPSGNHCTACGHVNIPNFKVCLSCFVWFLSLTPSSVRTVAKSQALAPVCRLIAEWSILNLRFALPQVLLIPLRQLDIYFTFVLLHRASDVIVKQGAVQTSGAQEFQGRLRYAFAFSRSFIADVVVKLKRMTKD
jgi:hypothetical protein